MHVQAKYSKMKLSVCVQLFLCFKQLTVLRFELTLRIWYFFSTLVCFSSSFSHAVYQSLSCVIQRHQVLQFLSLQTLQLLFEFPINL